MSRFDLILYESHSTISYVTVEGIYGRAYVVRLQEGLNAYFKVLINSIPTIEILSRYTTLIRRDNELVEAYQRVTIESKFGGLLNQWTDEHNLLLEQTLRTNMEQALEAGYKLQAAEFAESLGIPHNLGDVSAVTEVIRAESVMNVRERVGIITSQMDNTTRNAMLNTIELAANEVRTAKELLSDIKKQFRQSKIEERTLLTAQLNTNNMLSLGAFQLANDVGSQGKSWVTVGDSKVDPVICETNGAEGMIPIHQAHLSGHAHPSGHYRCRCTELYSEPTQRLLGFLGF